MSGILKIKRIYEPEEADDGKRILVDRLWPRGISKLRADLYEWHKDSAPENEERKSFHDGKEDFEQFKEHYLAWLNQSEEAEALAAEIESLLAQSNVTLLFGAKDQEHNNAVVLKEWLEHRLNRQSKPE